MSIDPAVLAEQKALLAARAEYDRTRLAFALQGILAVVAPEPDMEDRAESRTPGFATFVTVLASVFGARKVARWVRLGSMGLTAFRFIRNWRQMR